MEFYVNLSVSVRRIYTYIVKVSKVETTFLIDGIIAMTTSTYLLHYL